MSQPRGMLPLGLAAGATLLLSTPAVAVPCAGSLLAYNETGNAGNTGANICGTFCHDPVIGGVSFSPAPGCDPTTTACGVTASAPITFPGNHQNPFVPGFSWATVILEDADAALIGQCGTPFAAITQDLGTASFSRTLSCDDAAADPDEYRYTLKAVSCFMFSCEEITTTDVDLGGALGCPPPPPPAPSYICGGDAACNNCPFGGGGDAGSSSAGSPSSPGEGPPGGGSGGGASVGGGGAGVAPEGTGPGATLRYAAGGVGHPAYAQPAWWTATLGRFWSHDAAEVIVPDPDASHVWLLTRFGTFREFTDTDADPTNGYESVSPSDEYRRLVKTAGGWELRFLEGTVQHFDNDGLWTQTVDRNGNTSVASYSGSQLTAIDFPDGRSETFTYQPGGKLATITEVGVDALTTRTWSYTWTGDDLTRIDRPDGTAWEFAYGDPAHPGFMTLMKLIGTDASERIERGWEYDATGNVVTSWRGALLPGDPDAVDVWSLAFDDPTLPTQATVTDPLGNASVYTVDRDPASTKPRVTQISGDCPTCGLGPNTQLFYEDPAHPLRITRQVDGRGVETRFTYDAQGQVISRIEAFGDALERETTWQYDPTFPALVTEVAQPSTSGDPLDVRRTVSLFDAMGNQEMRTIEGLEAGNAFSLTTDTMFSDEGMPLTIDPPGYGTADQTSFLYDPARGDLFVASRTDPLIGTTAFTYDVFNRRSAVTDPNGVTTETQYDTLDRVRFVIQKAADPRRRRPRCARSPGPGRRR